ncbi:MAG TPA: hypothetical protein VF954_04165 [Acidimicrobiales bacterium]
MIVPAGDDARPSAMERELVLASVVEAGVVTVAEVAADTGFRPTRVREALLRLAIDDAVVSDGERWRPGRGARQPARRHASQAGGLAGSA